MSDVHEVTYRVTAIPGDGIGPEIVTATRGVLDATCRRFGFAIEWTEILAGGIAIDAYGTAIRDEDLEVLLASDAVLLGAVGGPKWDDPAATGTRDLRSCPTDRASRRGPRNEAGDLPHRWLWRLRALHLPLDER